MLILIFKTGKIVFILCSLSLAFMAIQYATFLYIPLLYINCCSSFPTLIRLKSMILLDKFHMENHGFQQVVNVIQETKSLYQLIMYLAPSLRKPNYSGLKKQSFYLFLHTAGWWINGIAPAGNISMFQKEGLGKSEKPNWPYPTFFIIKTKAFPEPSYHHWDR